jgi:hypothetical protein
MIPGSSFSEYAMKRKLRQFITGMGSALDLGGTSIPGRTRAGDGLNLRRTPAEALDADWRKLSQDFNSAFSDTVKDGSGHVKSE